MDSPFFTMSAMLKSLSPPPGVVELQGSEVAEPALLTALRFLEFIHPAPDARTTFGGTSVLAELAAQTAVGLSLDHSADFK